MPGVTINDIDDEPEARLRTRASLRGRSMQDEVHDILRAALSEDETPRDPRNLLDVIRSRVGFRAQSRDRLSKVEKLVSQSKSSMR
ncbi:hypothetical protein BX592_12335 [Paraburkholderia rhizosphaerae]|uniref:Antitoxin FitA-like ribbon-helix-helix domain-containing protein n=2 Tax=Paraburkholderia rhizosphaerae TaxID=480658 RepID=A0A4R8LIL0_9BURK|nr:hypothetical protein BX592_12335 [Paraburkholderia rhizosphaerae]